jgi:hypothetical protein
MRGNLVPSDPPSLVAVKMMRMVQKNTLGLRSQGLVAAR